MHMAIEVVHMLDIAQKSRVLSEAEFGLPKASKKRILGLAAIEQARKQQYSRVTNLREGDANTEYFHPSKGQR